MVNLGETFVTSETDLTMECGRSPFEDLTKTTMLGRPMGKKEAAHIQNEVRLVLRKLIEQQRFFLFESLKQSQRLGIMKHLHIRVIPDDEPWSEPDSKNRTIKLSTGLIKEDFLQVVQSAAPLCTLHGIHISAQPGNWALDLGRLNTIGATLEFVIRFQLLHEAAHILLRHTTETAAANERCEELEADRFALDYLYAIRDVTLMFPNAYLPLDSMWPLLAEGPDTTTTHPPRSRREDQAWQTRVLRDAAFEAFRPKGPPPSKLSILGAIVGTSFLDADVYQANFGLEQYLTKDTACRSKQQPVH